MGRYDHVGFAIWCKNMMHLEPFHCIQISAQFVVWRMMYRLLHTGLDPRPGWIEN